MTAAPLSARSDKSLLYAMVGLWAAVILAVGYSAELHQTMPDTPSRHLPIMADAPVRLPDGDALYVQRHEVTIAEWNICYAEGGCQLEVKARPDQDPVTTPATGISYADAQEYITWISRETGHRFRLPKAKEWAYMATSVLPEESDPLFNDPALSWASSYMTERSIPRALKPQGSFSVSPEGIADLDGSVWEWTQDCYSGDSKNVDPSRCAAFWVGGEHIAAISFLIRDPINGGCAAGTPPAHLGLRLVSDDEF